MTGLLLELMEVEARTGLYLELIKEEAYDKTFF